MTSCWLFIYRFLLVRAFTSCILVVYNDCPLINNPCFHLVGVTGRCGGGRYSQYLYASGGRFFLSCLLIY